MTTPKSITCATDLKRLGFDQLGSITLSSITKKIVYHLDKRDDYQENNWVYIWVAEKPRNMNLQVCYVGQTGQNAHHRRSTWQAALNAGHRARIAAMDLNLPEPEGKGRGYAVRKKVMAAIVSGYTITVWVRLSDRQPVFDVDVPMTRVEEEALIRKYDPLWNWKGDNINPEISIPDEEQV
ncbi:MAG: hypothetical protein ACT6U0_07770 [Shinella sp.]|uniref:hypothetical protein n=1 Tax=Shinella sp. TaxID=1870904 RepID=UPI00403740B6